MYASSTDASELSSALAVYLFAFTPLHSSSRFASPPRSSHSSAVFLSPLCFSPVQSCPRRPQGHHPHQSRQIRVRVWHHRRLHRLLRRPLRFAWIRGTLLPIGAFWLLNFTIPLHCTLSQHQIPWPIVTSHPFHASSIPIIVSNYARAIIIIQ
ncbi:hypothetical protein EV421DRAFT_200305 [Armillaria borealis]|uniref:Uncharacterized protein n=1 Tax=Armillaria borealis TaxID=47425 RepID=A0AA39MF00_9AGAR|nr:hypothetical protein EV421DRAFT_200305 [Armillaria borealis]